MLPETGAAAGATAANQQQQEQIAAKREDSADASKPEEGRLGDILEIMSNSEDISPELLKQEQSNGDDKAKARTSDKAADDDAGEADGERDRSPEEIRADRGAGEGEGVTAQTDDETPTAQEREEWPEEALGRIHKLAAKKAELKTRAETAEQEREALKAEKTALEQKLAGSPSAVQPTAADPLAGVETPAQLAQAERDYEEILEFAELHRDGAEDVVVGKNADGSSVTRDYSAEDIARMKLTADRVLRRIVPNKRVFLQAREKERAVAQQLYPEVFQDGTELRKMYEEFTAIMPELKTRVIDPERTVVRYLRGLQLEIAEQEAKAKANNGKGAASPNPTVAKFLKKQPPLAPGVPIARSPAITAQPAARIDKAEERAMEDGGSEEAIGDLVGNLRSAGPRGRQPAPA